MRPQPTPGVPQNAPSIADGRYLLVSRIGEGGMAGVYRAWDERLRVWRAVKVLFPQYASRPSVRQRFAGEAHTMARLEHPNLVRIYDVGDAGPLPFLVMELVDGGTLQQWVLEFGGMAPRLATQVILDITDAVGATHAAGVVHRDVKPHNVLITATGRCKLTDFGIAHDRENDLTQTGMIMGTLGYMAPEQRHNAKGVDHRADIYALGSTLWTLLSGETAHDLFNAPADPALLEPIPVLLRPIVLRCCAYARTERYPDIASLKADLQEALSKLPPDPPGAPTLHAELHHEEPLTDTPKFPEIRAILDTGVSSIEDTPHQPVPRQALPYFMPRASPEPRPSEDLPDYLDASAQDPGSGSGFVIGVQQEHTRPAKDPTPPPADPTFNSLPPEPRELPRARRPVTPPPAPTVHPLTRLLTLVSVPLGIALALGTVVVTIALIVFAITGYQLYDSASTTTASRSQLYASLVQERSIIDHLALDVPRAPLDQAYLAWMETRQEPDRIAAALAFLDEVDAAATQRSRDASELNQGTDHTIRRLKAIRSQYERDLELWSARASSPSGSVVIATGAGRAPPEAALEGE